jgi:hypothetical protein
VLGRTVKFVDSRDPEAFKRAVGPKTRAVYAETIGNPKLDVPDFEVLAKIAHENGLPLVADNTVGIGLVRPIDHGADIIVVGNGMDGSGGRGFPEEAVSPRKQAHLVSAAEAYFEQHPDSPETWQFDIIAITRRPGAAPEIEHFENVIG